jgi:predicted AlkP superfamily pyrophosphatase or phosphodiesterase
MRRLVIIFAFFAAAAFAQDRRVVLISVDGLRPDIYLEPEAHGAELPNFRRLVREGVFVEGVVGVYPSVTYPSHTSIVTGVRPVRHGVLNNYVFDPTGRFDDWYWSNASIKVPALWDVAPGRTAAIHWPVTEGAMDIDYNFPEFWIPGSRKSFRDVEAEVVTPELFELIESELGPLPDEAIDEAPLDELKFDIAELVLEHYHPELLLLHVYNTDTQEHRYGLEHREVAKAFELVDRRIGELRRKLAALGLDDETLFVVTGDHGFIETHTSIHLNALLARAGLLDLAPDGTVASYRAIAWPAGGAAAIVLAEPEDRDAREAVETLFDETLAGPLGGVMTKVSRERLDELGAFPGALFALEAEEGYFFGTHRSGPVPHRQRIGAIMATSPTSRRCIPDS